MWRQADVIAVHQHSVSVRELLIKGSNSNCGSSRRLSGRATIPACALRAGGIFHVTNRLRAIRPIPKAVPHDLVGHGACRGGNVVRGPLFSRRAQRRVPFSCYPNPSSRLSRLSPAD
jgi:hypothetical protein